VFQFRLQRLLDHKEAETSRAKYHVDRMRLGRWVALQNLWGARKREISAVAYLREVHAQSAMRPGDWAPAIAHALSIVGAMQDASREAAGKANVAAAGVDEAQSRYMIVWRSKERLVELKRRDHARFRRERERKERAEMTEVGSVMHYLNRIAAATLGEN
jgi:flagellar biosynthesis chaperone FliJ